MSKGGQALYEIMKIGLDAAGQRKLRKTLTAIYEDGGAVTLERLDKIGNVTDAANLLIDIHKRDGTELMADTADTLLGLANFAPGLNIGVIGARMVITISTDVRLAAIEEADRKSAERYEKAVQENIEIGEAKLNELKSEYRSLGCK